MPLDTDQANQIQERAETPSSTSNRDEWLRLAYELCWEQYAHEDELRHHKNVLYLTIQTALLALAPATLSFSDKLGTVTVSGLSLDLRFFAVPLAVLILSIIGCRVCQYWANVIRAGRGYLYLRLATAAKIEYEAQLGGNGLAQIEHDWDKFSKADPNRNPDLPSYTPFPEPSALSHIQMYPKGSMGESRAALSITRVLLVVWRAAAFFSTLTLLILLLKVMLQLANNYMGTQWACLAP